MEDRPPLLALVVVAVVALFGGLALGAMLLGGDGSAGPTATPVAQASDGPSPVETSVAASDEAPSDEAPTEAAGSEQPSAAATPGATASVAPAPAATIT